MPSDKSSRGLAPSSKTSTGLSSVTVTEDISGGDAGKVPYQIAPGVTTFTNAVNGVLENKSNAVNFTSDTTTISSILSPAGTDLLLSAPPSKRVKITAQCFLIIKPSWRFGVFKR